MLKTLLNRKIQHPCSPKSLRKLIFQKDTPDLTCGFVYLWHITDSSGSKNSPGFKGCSWEKIVLWAKGTTWMEAPGFAVVLHFPFPLHREWKHFHFRKHMKIPSFASFLSSLVKWHLTYTSVPTAKRMWKKCLYVKERNKAFSSHHNDYPAIARSYPTGQTMKVIKPLKGTT